MRILEYRYEEEIDEIYHRDTLIVGDNTAIMKKLPDKLVDLTVTSPPYDDLRKYDGYSFDFETVAEELYRITKEGGVVVWVVGDQTKDGDESGNSFRQALYFKEVGFKLHDTMIYIKNGGLNSGSLLAYQQKFEYMFVFSKGRPKSINLIRDRKNKHTAPRRKRKRQADGSYVTQVVETPKYGVRYNYWIYNTGRGHSTKDDIAFEHPAIFPEKLAEDHIISWSDEGDLIFDPFAGSGTTLKMAKKNNRHYLGCEISRNYVSIIKERMSDINED